jgi:polar amino acid transport system permease protein
MDLWRLQEVWRYREALAQGLLVTLQLNGLVLLAGTALGFSVGALRLSRSAPLRLGARLYVDLFRSFPALVLLFWLFFALPLLPGLPLRLNAFPAAVLGLSLNLSAFVAEIFRAGVLAVPTSHLEAAQVMGFSRRQTWRYIAGPIALRIMVAPLFGQYINQIKLSVLASVIAVPELLHSVNTITTETFRPLELYTTLAALFLALLIPCTYLQGLLEARLSRPSRPRANGNGTPAHDLDRVCGDALALPHPDGWAALPRASRLTVRGLTCAYNDTPVLRDVSFEVAAGTVTVCMGPNGSGKTTLGKRLVGLLDRATGEVGLSNGRCLADVRVGYLAQDHEPFPHLSVQDNLILPLMVTAGNSRREARDIAHCWLTFFQLEAYAQARPATLSGGQRQRLALARSLCLQPQVLVLDEPTSAMDFRWALVVYQLVRNLADRGLIIVAITHAVGFVRAVADQVVFLDHGGVAEAGPASRLLQPQTAALKSFLEAA